MTAVRTIVVLGSWSSGSTAVAGYLARLGAFTGPPHQRTNDPRTPDSHEPKELRNALATLINEFELTPRREDLSAFRPWFTTWLARQQDRAADHGYTHIVLKHPLAAFFIADIQAVCQPAFVVVTRPFAAIERSRQRRGWHPVYGRAGAKVIYERIFGQLLAQDLNALSVSFERFRRDPTLGGHLNGWVGMAPSADALAEARSWVT